MPKTTRKPSAVIVAPSQATPAADLSKTRRKPLDAVEAFKIFNAAPDEALLPPEVIAPVIGRDSIPALEKMRCIGEGPSFCKVGRLVRYRAGEIRRYLNSLEQHAMTA